MPVFQVSTRSVQLAAPPRRRPRRFPSQWYAVARVVAGLTIAGLTFGFLLTRFTEQSHFAVFILLPVLLSLATGQFQGYNLNALLRGRPVYLLLTVFLTFIYYGGIVAGISFIQQSVVSHIIIIATALSWTIMLDPVRSYVQQRITQRFNQRDQETARVLDAFTATLREEIDLDQLRERFLTVIQSTMQPYSVSVWIRTSHEQLEPSSSIEEIVLANDDPLMAYILGHPGVREIDRLQLDSPVLQELKLHAAEMLLPLASQGELMGLLILGPHQSGRAYTPQECTMLDTLAPQVAPALRVVQMVREQKEQVRERERIEQEQVRERERIEQELQTARAIQHAFLPKDVPAFPGWQFAPYYRPAREVGGDFYDFLPFEDGRLGLVIGDVSGKGIPAALVMATVHTMLRTAVQGMVSPGEVLARVNDLLAADIPSGMFVTCFYALLDPESGRLSYANAGQDLPYRYHSNGVSELWATGMPLGLMPGSDYQEHEVTIAPGEGLLFYSDGLVEAHNSRREMFDTPRLKAVLAEHADGVSLIEMLLGELRCFTGEEWEQEDDVTLLTLQRTTRETPALSG